MGSAISSELHALLRYSRLTVVIAIQQMSTMASKVQTSLPAIALSHHCDILSRGSNTRNAAGNFAKASESLITPQVRGQGVPGKT